MTHQDLDARGRIRGLDRLIRSALDRAQAAPLWAFALAAFALILAMLMVPSILPHQDPPPVVAAGDVGSVDFSFAANGVKAPTGRKPEAAKLWFNDGTWWGSLFEPARDGYLIHRFDSQTGTWHDTGTMIDDRNTSRADVLWDGRYLYAVSGGTDPTSTKHNALFLRFSYDKEEHQYSLDRGFPIALTEGGAETFVLDEDADGHVWVTFTRNETVYVTHSRDTDRSWTVPYPLPIPEAANLTPDDISAVVAYDGHVGVMWSDQTDGAMYFAAHPNGADDATWSLSTPIQGPSLADDHMNLKALPHDPAGLVFAAVKTSLNDVPNADPDGPLIVLLALQPDGSWEQHPFGRVKDQQTRPLLEIDQEHRRLYVFVSAPCCSGGTIYYKSTSLDRIDFPDGVGTPFMREGRASAINNPASTRQNLDSTSNLLVIASDDKSDTYIHNVVDLTGPPVAPPTAAPAAPGGAPSSPAPGEVASGASTPGRVWLDDGFESGDLRAWSTVRTGPGGSAVVESGGARSDRYAARFSSIAADGSLAYARFALPAPQAAATVSLDVKLLSEGLVDGNVPLLRLFDPQGERLLTLYRQNQKEGRIWVGVGAGHDPTTGRLGLETWGHVELKLVPGTSGSLITVRLDGRLVYEGQQPKITGSEIGAVQIGNDSHDQPFELLVDNVRVHQ